MDALNVRNRKEDAMDEHVVVLIRRKGRKLMVKCEGGELTRQDWYELRRVVDTITLPEGKDE